MFNSSAVEINNNGVSNGVDASMPASAKKLSRFRPVRYQEYEMKWATPSAASVCDVHSLMPERREGLSSLRQEDQRVFNERQLPMDAELLVAGEAAAAAAAAADGEQHSNCCSSLAGSQYNWQLMISTINGRLPHIDRCERAKRSRSRKQQLEEHENNCDFCNQDGPAMVAAAAAATLKQSQQMSVLPMLVEPLANIQDLDLSFGCADELSLLGIDQQPDARAESPADPPSTPAASAAAAATKEGEVVQVRSRKVNGIGRRDMVQQSGDETGEQKGDGRKRLRNDSHQDSSDDDGDDEEEEEEEKQQQQQLVEKSRKRRGGGCSDLTSCASLSNQCSSGTGASSSSEAECNGIGSARTSFYRRESDSVFLASSSAESVSSPASATLDAGSDSSLSCLSTAASSVSTTAGASGGSVGPQISKNACDAADRCRRSKPHLAHLFTAERVQAAFNWICGGKCDQDFHVSVESVAQAVMMLSAQELSRPALQSRVDSCVNSLSDQLQTSLTAAIRAETEPLQRQIVQIRAALAVRDSELETKSATIVELREQLRASQAETNCLRLALADCESRLQAKSDRAPDTVDAAAAAAAQCDDGGDDGEQVLPAIVSADRVCKRLSNYHDYHRHNRLANHHHHYRVGNQKKHYNNHHNHHLQRRQEITEVMDTLYSLL